MSLRYIIVAAAVVALLQSVAIAGMIYDRASKIRDGKEVVVESGMIDPRDLFRGHYVRLNLTVGNVQKDSITIDRTFKSRETVYVELAKGEGLYWQAKKLWHERPATSDGVFLKGVMLWAPRDAKQPYRISFPFDRYFAPKQRALELEGLQRKRRLGVVLAVSPDGSAHIKGISIDDKRILDAPLY